MRFGCYSIIGFTCSDSASKVSSRAILGVRICARVRHDSRRHLFGLSTCCRAFSWQLIIDWPVGIEVLPGVLHPIDFFVSVVHLELSDPGGIQSLAQECIHTLTHACSCMHQFFGILVFPCFDSIRRGYTCGTHWCARGRRDSLDGIWSGLARVVVHLVGS
jgi:hypothetical protein